MHVYFTFDDREIEVILDDAPRAGDVVVIDHPETSGTIRRRVDSTYWRIRWGNPPGVVVQLSPAGSERQGVDVT